MLICDDEAVLRRLVRASLRERDYELIDAADGDEALLLAREQEPDLILLDVMMPGRTGLDVLLCLQQESRLASIPVVMLTARTQDADRAAALGAGVRRFLPKPFSPSELGALVDELLVDAVAEAGSR
ncbi:MAG: response regulator [Actinobacteria bacterium]|nr:response regulator [Actinomycetota bacterium]